MYAQVYVHQVHCLRGSKHFTSSIYGWLYNCLPFSCKIYPFGLTVPDMISTGPDLFVVLYFEIQWPWRDSKMMIGGKCGKGKCTYTLRIKQCLCYEIYKKNKSRERIRKQFNKQNKQTCVENHDKLTDKHRLNSRASLEKYVRQGSIWECGS